MLDLGEESMAAWASKLPPDVRGVIAAGEAPSPAGAPALSAAFASGQAGAAGAEAELARLMPSLLREHAGDVLALGRAGRLRIAMWMALQGGENPGPVLRRLVGPPDAEDSEGGGDSAAADAVGLMFLEDIRAFAAEVVGPRLARRIVDGQSLGLAAEAAFTLESDLVYRQGGM